MVFCGCAHVRAHFSVAWRIVVWFRMLCVRALARSYARLFAQIRVKNESEWKKCDEMCNALCVCVCVYVAVEKIVFCLLFVYTLTLTHRHPKRTISDSTQAAI